MVKPCEMIYNFSIVSNDFYGILSRLEHLKALISKSLNI
ncbi:hypothetical protein ABWED_0397 [Acinetobacter lwoffii]|nr:hypothetical protein ABWED_0397 [Acinetobacter lwoffii]